MASILNSKARRYQRDSQESIEAAHYVESDADIFIKELSNKQLRTNYTLNEQLRQERKFHSSHTYQPITEQTSGALTYDEFKHISATEEYQTGENVDSDAKETRNVSRHIRELALAVKPNSTETKLLEFAIACNTVGSIKPENRPKDHPINYLPDLNKELFSHLTKISNPEKTAKTILRKRRQLLETTSDPIEIKSKPNLVGNKSLWDIDELPLPNEKKSPEKQYSCQKEKLFTIRNGEIVSLSDMELKRKRGIANESTITEQSNISATKIPNRISEDEIKNLRQFQNYQKGEPSKNLSPRVREDDLSTWVSEFQSNDQPPIVYTLMKSGKMRGQAFIHFNCIDTASKALEKLNGCIMYGKPLIIQFSKSRR